MPTLAQSELNEHLKFEDQLINNRLTWLLTSEGLLFAGYGAIISSDKIPTDKVVKLAGIFVFVGVTLSILIFIGILAAVLASIRYRKNLEAEHKSGKLELGIWKYATVFSWAVACGIPLVFALGWILLQIATSRV